jgi:peptide/nickel transport system substrate-binding protein
MDLADVTPLVPAGNGRSATSPQSATTTDENVEWELSQFVDSIAAEIDRAEDTLSLKSYGRGVAFAIKQLNLELAVSVRRSAEGRILFRSVAPDTTVQTVLKLDFSQVLQSQLQGIRKPLEEPGPNRALSTLAGITNDDIQRLNGVGVYSVDDLERYTQTAAMLAELSRKAGIEETRLRRWRQLPFLEAVKPASGPPGTRVLLEGGNLGDKPDSQTLLLFQGQPALIQSWSTSRIEVTMPSVTGPGVVFGVIGGQLTNSVAWEATAIDLVVSDLRVDPDQPLEHQAFTAQAVLSNTGTSPAPSFDVQWQVDTQVLPPEPHGPLQPGQQSMESSATHHFTLDTGKHIIRFTADPYDKVPEINQANSTFSREILVSALRQLVVGDYRRVDSLDPLRNADAGPGDVFGLLFRGVLRNSLDASHGTEPDLALSSSLERRAEGDTLVMRLRSARFHDGSPVTADDVAFTYETIRSIDSPYAQMVQATFAKVRAEDERTVAFVYKPTQSVPKAIWTIGIVPRAAYSADPAAFARKPIGCGPFRLETFDASGQIVLSSFADYMLGAPRLGRIVLRTNVDPTLLKQLLMKLQVDAAAFAYSKQLQEELTAVAGLVLTPVPTSFPRLLHAQRKSVLERVPNEADTTWNAHLWYLASP